MVEQQPYQGVPAPQPTFMPQTFTPQSFAPQPVRAEDAAAPPAQPQPAVMSPSTPPYVQPQAPDPSRMSDDELRAHVAARAEERAETFRVPPQPAYAALAQPTAAPPQPVVWTQPAAFAAAQQPRLGSLVTSSFAALGVGVVIGLVYALVTALSRHDFFMFVVLIGAGIGVTVQMVAKRSDLLTGTISAILTVLVVLFAEYLALTFVLAGAVGGLVNALTLVSPHRILEVYLGDPISLLWLAGAVIMGFLSGSRLGR